VEIRSAREALEKAIAAIGAMIAVSLPAHAMTQDDLMHMSAHTGVSFALQTGFYGINSRWLGMDNEAAQVVGFLETMAVGWVYKDLQGFPSDTGRAMGFNALGAGSAILTQVTFRF
jgi:hypothetical protein